MKPIYIEDRQGDDATRDAIYLFQRKVFGFLTEITDWEDYGLKIDDEGNAEWIDQFDQDGEKKYASDQDLHEMGLAYIEWRTENVFASRQEAKAFGERRPYAWGLEGEGWRTYSVCSEGSLTEFFKERWSEWVSTKPTTNEDGGMSIPVMVAIKPGDDVIMRAGNDGTLSVLYGVDPTKAMVERYESQKDGRQ